MSFGGVGTAAVGCTAVQGYTAVHSFDCASFCGHWFVVWSLVCWFAVTAVWFVVDVVVVVVCKQRCRLSV